jgi:hypothetical protein
LAGLFFGAAGQSLAREEPAPRAQATSCLGNTIAQWTFDGLTDPVISPIPPSFGQGTLSVVGGVTASLDNSSGVANPPAVNFSAWDIVPPTPAPTSTPDPASTKYVELSISTLGRNSIFLTFTSNRTGTGPTTFVLQYSVNGGAFTVFDVVPRTITTGDLTYNYDFGSALDAASATIRLFAYSAGSPSGNWRLDNITFTGSCITPGDTPTPTSSSAKWRGWGRSLLLTTSGLNFTTQPVHQSTWMAGLSRRQMASQA